MVRILLLLALPAIVIAATGCANVDCTGVPGCSTDGNGGNGGTGGNGGNGGTAGTGGTGGTGGSGGDLTLLPEPVLSADPQSFAAEPPIDSVDEEAGVTNGEVAGACPTIDCTGTDPVDQWTVTPVTSAEYRIALTWAPVALSDLDLYLTNSSGAEIDASATPGTTPETIVANLTAGQTFTIQVQAFETNDATQPYTLEVTGNE
jgi:hypothetical protein